MPNKYKKLPGTCTLHLMSIVFWRALTTSQPFNFKASKTSSASSTAPPARDILPLVWIRCSVLRPDSFGGCWSVTLVEHYLWCGRAGPYIKRSGVTVPATWGGQGGREADIVRVRKEIRSSAKGHTNGWIVYMGCSRKQRQFSVCYLFV